MLGEESRGAYFGFCPACVEKIEAAGMRVLAGSLQELVQQAQREKDGAPDRRVARGPDIRPGRVIGDSGDVVSRCVEPERAGPHRVTPPSAAAVAVAEARVATPAPAASVEADPIAAMGLNELERQMTMLQEMRAVLGERIYAEKMLMLREQRWRLEDHDIASARTREDAEQKALRDQVRVELGKTLGKAQADSRPAAPVLKLVSESGPRVEKVAPASGGEDPDEQEWAAGAEQAPTPTIMVCNACNAVKGNPHERLGDVPIFKPAEFTTAEVCFDALAQTGPRYRDLVRIHAPETATEAELRNHDSDAAKQAKHMAKDCPLHGSEVRKIGGFRYDVIEHIKAEWSEQWRERKHAVEGGNGHTSPLCAYCNGPGGSKMHENKPACQACKNRLTATKREGRRSTRAADDAELRTRMKGAAGGGGGKRKRR